VRLKFIVYDFKMGVKTWLRSKGTVFWTLLFPVLLILIFGAIFSGADEVEYTIAVQDLDDSDFSKGFIENLLLSGFHPIFPWISFALIGTVAGSYLLAATKNKKESKYAIITLAIGAILSTIGLIINFTKQKIIFYPASVSFVIFFTGLSLVIFAISFYIFDIKNKFKKAGELISFLGSVSLSFYVLHILIGLGFFYLTSSFYTLSINALIPYVLFVLITIYIICYISKNTLKAGPFEYLMKKIF